MRKIWLCAGILTLSVFALLTPNLTHALSQPAIPAKPNLDSPIIDQTKTLSQEQITAIAKRIQETRTEKSYQIGILMIASLDGYPIEEYSIKVAREWGIGEKDKNNGILLLIAKDDRRMRIEVGSGLEGDLTDLQSSHVIDDVIAPEFKEGNYYQGIYKGVESMSALVQGQSDPHEAGSEGILEIILSFGWVAFLGLMWLGSILGRSKSWWAGGVVGGVVGAVVAVIFGFVIWSLGILVLLIVGGLLLDFFVSRNFDKHKALGDAPAWWAGGGWGGGLGGGGGGGSFGGGGFSGGGSSGGW